MPFASLQEQRSYRQRNAERLRLRDGELRRTKSKIFRLATREEWKRFWSRVWKTETCWLWLGKHNDQGRAIFNFQYENHRAARWLQEQMRREDLPREIQVCHHCDNPSCVKPRCCFLGTHQDNTDDCVQKGRNSGPAPKDKCKLGHDEWGIKTSHGRQCRYCLTCNRARCQRSYLKHKCVQNDPRRFV